MLQSTSGNLGHGSAQTGAAALRQDNAVGTQSLSGANDRAEVMGVGEAIEGEQ